MIAIRSAVKKCHMLLSLSYGALWPLVDEGVVLHKCKA